MRKKKKQRRLRPQANLTTRIKLIQRKLQHKRRKKQDWQHSRHKIMVVSRKQIKSIMIRLSKRDKPNWQEFHQPQRNLKLLIQRDWLLNRRDSFLSRRQKRVLQTNFSEGELRVMRNQLCSSTVKRSINCMEPASGKFFMEEPLPTELKISSKNFARISQLIAILNRSKRSLTTCRCYTTKN